jgi:hypothetical protein
MFQQQTLLLMGLMESLAYPERRLQKYARNIINTKFKYLPKHTFIRVIPNQTNILAEKKTLQILKNIETESFKLPIQSDCKMTM